MHSISISVVVTMESEENYISSEKYLEVTQV